MIFDNFERTIFDKFGRLTLMVTLTFITASKKMFHKKIKKRQR